MRHHRNETTRAMLLRWSRNCLGVDAVRDFAAARYPDSPRPVTRLTTDDARELFAAATQERLA